MSEYYRHRNRHGGGDGQWGWITALPDWQSTPVAHWTGWAGSDGATVLCGHPRQPDHDYCLPWSVVAETKINAWDADSWRVINSKGYTVLSDIHDWCIAEKVVSLAGGGE